MSADCSADILQSRYLPSLHCIRGGVPGGFFIRLFHSVYDFLSAALVMNLLFYFYFRPSLEHPHLSRNVRTRLLVSSDCVSRASQCSERFNPRGEVARPGYRRPKAMAEMSGS